MWPRANHLPRLFMPQLPLQKHRSLPRYTSARNVFSTFITAFNESSHLLIADHNTINLYAIFQQAFQASSMALCTWQPFGQYYGQVSTTPIYLSPTEISYLSPKQYILTADKHCLYFQCESRPGVV